MKFKQFSEQLGPGFVMAATGLGAGDLVAAAVAGSKFGYLLLWAVVLGAIVKFALNEGIARWQLSSNTSVIEGISTHLPRWVSWYFLAFLFLWSFIVAGALMSASGLAAHALFPEISVAIWAMIHAVIGLLFIVFGNYQWLERLMKFCIALMFFMVIACAIMITDDFFALFKAFFSPSLPPDSLPLVLAIIGGVGGSVTILCYGYWLKEKNWIGDQYLKTSRIDLGLAYSLTALFGIGIIIVAAGAQPETMKGAKMAVALANQLEVHLGTTGKWFFLIGFWAAVFSSLLGVWHGVPALYQESIKSSFPGLANNPLISGQKAFLLFLTFPPMLLLLFDKPVWLVITYALTGAFFMPFLAGVLLYLNNSKQLDSTAKNRWLANVTLALSAILFIALLGLELQKRFG